MSDFNLDAIKVRIEAELPWLGGSDQMYYALTDRRDLVAEVERLTAEAAGWRFDFDNARAEIGGLREAVAEARAEVVRLRAEISRLRLLLGEEMESIQRVRDLCDTPLSMIRPGDVLAALDGETS